MKPVGPRGDHLQLFYLYVSRPVRGQGVGRRLFDKAGELARVLGAKALYISAVPTQNTVDFYLRRGARLIGVPDPELFAAEPEDIHFSFPL